MNYTPEPWQQHNDQTPDGWITIIGNVDGEYIDGQAHCTYDVIARCEDEYGERLPNAFSNAARIVSCVNALAGLNPKGVRAVLEALENAASFMESLADNDPDEPIADNGMTVLGKLQFDAPELALKARAALAKVRAGA